MSKQGPSRNSGSDPGPLLRLLRALLLRVLVPRKDGVLINAHLARNGSDAKAEVLAQFHAAEYASERNSVDVWKTLQYALVPIIFVAWSLLYQVREALTLELFRWAFAAVLPICYVAYQKAMVDALTGVLLIEKRVRPLAIELAGSDEFWFHEPFYRKNVKRDAAYGWYWPPLLSFASPLVVLAYRVLVDQSFAKGDWWLHLATYGEVIGYSLCCGVAWFVGKLSKEGLALNRQIDKEIRRRKFRWLKADRPQPTA